MAVMVAAALTACSSAARHGELTSFQRAFVTPQPCTTQDCPVAVTVTEDPQTGTCSGTVNIPYLGLSTGPNGQRTITWSITDGYVFSTEPYKYAIIIKSDPRKQFKNANVEANGKRLVIQFAHTTSGQSYGYGLNFQRANGDFCKMLDPYMID